MINGWDCFGLNSMARINHMWWYREKGLDGWLR